MREVIECICKGVKPKEPYPPSVRAFCMSLHFTNFCAANLASICHILRRSASGTGTVSNLDAVPGINAHSLNALEAKAKTMKHPLVINLNFDEIHIYSNMSWDRASNKFIGLINYGTPKEDEEFNIAKQAIVYMAVGINAKFQQPMAYYFIQTLNGQERAQLLLEIIAEITKRGIIIADVSFDGYKANSLMCQYLGTKFELVNGDYKSYFINPYNNQKIQIIVDPSHAIKLVRNTLGNIKTIYEGPNKIEWQYLVDLVDFSANRTFGLTHKLTKRHIQYEDRKMHVRTAVETLSNSSANSLEVLKQKGLSNFAGADATIKFIRMFDKLFDVFNTQRIRSDKVNVFKSAINENNAAEIFEFLSDAKKYILSLSVINKRTGRMVSIVESQYNTAFRGFVLNINSIEAMYRDLVKEKHWMTFLASYRLSQDHIEMFFGEYNSYITRLFSYTVILLLHSL